MEERVEKNYKIALIGNDLLKIGFGISGITESYSVTQTEQAESRLRELLDRQDIGIVVITSGVRKLVKDRKLQDAITNSIMPLIVEVPEQGEEHAEQETLRRLILRAIGIDITQTIGK